MVSKWEAGGPEVRPRPHNQMALDVSLARSHPEVTERFWQAVGATSSATGLPRKGSGPNATDVFSHLVRHPDDGKLMTLIPAGFSPLGNPAAPVWMPAFYIDVFPTTNADYARFLSGTGRPAPWYWGGDTPPEDLADHPVVGVTLHDAHEYAVWSAKRLPDGRQWEKAARGPQGWPYPWGVEPTPMRCNVREARMRTTTAVGWYETGVSPFGVFDLCGNVWEWVASSGSQGWQARGGAFTTAYRRVLPSDWIELGANTSRDDLGFRTAVPLFDMLELLSI
jgi:formylglycine-generating enzyme required for sulfatase activity